MADDTKRVLARQMLDKDKSPLNLQELALLRRLVVTLSSRGCRTFILDYVDSEQRKEAELILEQKKLQQLHNIVLAMLQGDSFTEAVERVK